MRYKLAMVVLLGCAALAAGGEKPAAPETEKALQRPTGIEFIDQPADECFRYIQSMTAVNIIIDPACKATDKTPVTLHLTNATLRDALTWVCELSGRKYEIRDGAIYVTPKGDADKQPGKRPMTDELIKEFDQKLAKQLNYDFKGASLAEVIKFFMMVSDVNMIIDPKVKAKVEAAGKITAASERPVTLGEALDKFLEQAGLRREYRDGAVFITDKEKEKAKDKPEKP